MGVFGKSKEEKQTEKVVNTALQIQEKQKAEATLKESLFSDMDSIGNGNANDFKDIETVKIILKETLIKENLASLSNLDEEQKEGLSNTMSLNKVFKNPLVAKKCQLDLELSRSITKEKTNLLNHVFKLANNTGNNFNESGIGSIIGKFVRR